MQKSNAFWIQSVEFLFSLFFLGIFLLAVFRPDIIESVHLSIGEWSRSIGHWNAVILLVASFVESFPVIGVMVPGQQLFLLVGWFYGQTHFFIALCAGAVGAIGGNWIGFFIGKHFGEAFLEKYWSVFALGKPEQKILSSRIQKNGPLFIILGKFHNFTRAFVPFLAGTFHMENRLFWRYNVIGSCLWAGVMVVLGTFFTRYIHIVLDWISWFFLGILVAVGIYIACFRRREFLQYIQEKEQEFHQQR